MTEEWQGIVIEKLQLELPLPIVCNGDVRAALVMAFVEHVMFFRQQIPFPLSQLKATQNLVEKHKMKSFTKKRDIFVAQMSTLATALNCVSSNIESVHLIFGPAVSSAKENFVLHFTESTEASTDEDGVASTVQISERVIVSATRKLTRAFLAYWADCPVSKPPPITRAFIALKMKLPFDDSCLQDSFAAFFMRRQSHKIKQRKRGPKAVGLWIDSTDDAHGRHQRCDTESRMAQPLRAGVDDDDDDDGRQCVCVEYKDDTQREPDTQEAEPKLESQSEPLPDSIFVGDLRQLEPKPEPEPMWFVSRKGIKGIKLSQ